MTETESNTFNLAPMRCGLKLHNKYYPFTTVRWYNLVMVST